MKQASRPNRALTRTAQWATSGHWGGNIADQDICVNSYGGNTGIGCPPGSPNNYTEADADWFIACGSPGSPGNSIYASESAWVGVGGVHSWTQLVQAGDEIDQALGDENMFTFIEYAGAQNENPETIDVGLGCGGHIYAQATTNGSNGEYTIGNIATGDYWSSGPHGPPPDAEVAEFISELPTPAHLPEQPGLANFYSTDFKGMGVTTNGNYESMIQAEHDYFRLFWDDGSTELEKIGSLVTDPNDFPYDDNTITWITACPGVCY